MSGLCASRKLLCPLFTGLVAVAGLNTMPTADGNIEIEMGRKDKLC